MKYASVAAIGIGGIVLLFAATTSMLGIADNANSEQKETPATLTDSVDEHPVSPQPQLSTSFKQPAAPPQEHSSDTRSDHSPSQRSEVTPDQRSHRHKKSFISHTISETEQGASHVLSQIDSALSWPKTNQ